MNEALINKEALEALKELVHQHDYGFWSSWQTTAHFEKGLEMARKVLIKAGEYQE